MPTPNITISCGTCHHAALVTKAIVEKLCPDIADPSEDSILARLRSHRGRLRCSECGSRSFVANRGSVSPKQTINPPSVHNVPDHELRYINEGFGGTREEALRMRSTRWNR